MNLRLDDDEAASLERAAARAGTTMQQAAGLAINERVARAGRPWRSSWPVARLDPPLLTADRRLAQSPSPTGAVELF